VAGEPVSRILRGILKTRNLLIPFLAELSMTSAAVIKEGFLSQFFCRISESEQIGVGSEPMSCCVDTILLADVKDTPIREVSLFVDVVFRLKAF
jgi:hypothetical protein